MNQPKEKKWWNRNWKWIVPVGCLGALILIVGLGAMIVYLVFGFVKSSETYKQAVAKARTNSAVIEALGSPLKEGLLVAGSINISGSSGEADLAIPISGPKGKAILYAVATKSAGKWTLTTLELSIKASGERIDILFSDTDASQNSSEKAIQKLVSKIHLEIVNPSRNVNLKSSNSSEKDQINWSLCFNSSSWNWVKMNL